MTVKVANHTTFFNKLQDFLEYLVQFYPGSGGPEKALNFLSSFRALPETHERISSTWFSFTRPIKDAIRTGDALTVAATFESADNSIIKNMEASHILKEEDPDDIVWGHLRALTTLSEALHQPPQQQTTVMVPSQAPQQQQQQQQAPQQQQAKPPQANEVIKNIATAIPEIFKGLNDALKQDDGNNPLATIFKQLTSTGPTQADANFDAGATSVLQQTNLSPEEIVHKLKRLEVLEKWYKNRKAARQSND